jgi:hypothetical protein
MGTKTLGLAGILAGILLIASPLRAHTPICNCYDNGDDSVTCEGGFSDGASAEGVSIRVVNDQERVLIDGKMDGDGTFTFDWPADDFHVIFDAGDNHIVMIYMDDIE